MVLTADSGLPDGYHFGDPRGRRRPAHPILLDGEIAVSGDASSQLAINGLVLAAGSGMTPGSPAPAALVDLPPDRPGGTANLLSTLSITDCTVVPGWSVTPTGEPQYPGQPVLIAEPADVTVKILRSITRRDPGAEARADGHRERFPASSMRPAVPKSPTPPWTEQAAAAR